jgi:dihydropteroate synthase
LARWNIINNVLNIQEYTLLQFDCKGSLRKVLRQLGKTIKYSSIYSLGKKKYILVEHNIISVIAGVIVCDMPNRFEQIIKHWAYSEVTQSVEFIKFEHQTTLVKNGRLYLVDDTTIIRTFEYLADIFAILNYTQDSFSDGGKYKNLEELSENAIAQINSGAKILDIGVESTNPNSKPLVAEDEISILTAVLGNISSLRKQHDFTISIDTYHQETMQWLIDQDIDIVNDVSGNAHLNMIKSLSLANKKYVAMHSLVVPANKSIHLALECNPIEHIYAWMNNKLKQFSDAKIDLDNIILDPGIGFGNTPQQAWYILRNFAVFYNLPCELLLGHSRKSFFGYTNNKPVTERNLETMLVALKFINNIDYLRVHDVGIINELYPIIHHLY